MQATVPQLTKVSRVCLETFPCKHECTFSDGAKTILYGPQILDLIAACPLGAIPPDRAAHFLLSWLQDANIHAGTVHGFTRGTPYQDLYDYVVTELAKPPVLEARPMDTDCMNTMFPTANITRAMPNRMKCVQSCVGTFLAAPGSGRVRLPAESKWTHMGIQSIFVKHGNTAGVCPEDIWVALQLNGVTVAAWCVEIITTLQNGLQPVNKSLSVLPGMRVALVTTIKGKRVPTPPTLRLAISGVVESFAELAERTSQYLQPGNEFQAGTIETHVVTPPCDAMITAVYVVGPCLPEARLVVTGDPSSSALHRKYWTCPAGIPLKFLPCHTGGVGTTTIRTWETTDLIRAVGSGLVLGPTSAVKLVDAPDASLLFSVVQQVDMVTPNEIDAAAKTRRWTPQRAAWLAAVVQDDQNSFKDYEDYEDDEDDTDTASLATRKCCIQ